MAADRTGEVLAGRYELGECVAYQGDPSCIEPSHAHRRDDAGEIIPGCLDYHCPHCGESCAMTGHRDCPGAGE